MRSAESEPLWEVRPAGWKAPGTLLLAGYLLAALAGTMALLGGWWLDLTPWVRAPNLPQRLPLVALFWGGIALSEVLRHALWRGRSYRVDSEGVRAGRLLPPWAKRTPLERVNLHTFPGLPPAVAQELSTAAREQRSPDAEVRYAGTWRAALGGLVLIALLPGVLAGLVPLHEGAHRRYQERVLQVQAAVAAADSSYATWARERATPAQARVQDDHDRLATCGSAAYWHGNYTLAGRWERLQGGPDRWEEQVWRSVAPLGSSGRVRIEVAQDCAGWVPGSVAPPLEVRLAAEPSAGGWVYLDFLRAELRRHGVEFLVGRSKEER